MRKTWRMKGMLKLPPIHLWQGTGKKHVNLLKRFALVSYRFWVFRMLMVKDL
jgi:hypothetical protein